MRLGSIQQSIMTYLNRCGPNGGFIGSTTKAPEFGGLDLEQVERSLSSLLRRGVIRKEGIRYVVVDRSEAKHLGRALLRMPREPFTSSRGDT